MGNKNNKQSKGGFFDFIGKAIIGVVIGYLLGNDEARDKAKSAVKKTKSKISSMVHHEKDPIDTKDGKID